MVSVVGLAHSPSRGLGDAQGDITCRALDSSGEAAPWQTDATLKATGASV